MKENEKSKNYDDIIGIPHHVSPTHEQMSMRDRAAQFSPFAALTGYEDVIEETARITDEKIDLSEDGAEEINRELLAIGERIDDEPIVSVLYFCSDLTKSGGAYISMEGKVKSIDVYNRKILFKDGKTVRFSDIMAIKRKETE